MRTVLDSPEILLLRSFCIDCIRDYLRSSSHIELNSPILSPFLIPEQHISAYEVTEGAESWYLTPSPEINLKHILAELTPRLSSLLRGYFAGIFEITHSFRKTEQESPLHQPEFLMLECYSLKRTAHEMQNFTIAMLRQTIQRLLTQGRFSELLNKDLRLWLQTLENNVLRMSLAEAFERYTSLRLEHFLSCKTLKDCLYFAGLEQKSNTMDWEDIFHYLIAQYLEPSLPGNAMIFLRDYPQKAATLAREKNSLYSERWELYIAGIEVANCYREETDAKKILKFMQEQQEKKEAKNTQSKWNPCFLQKKTLPDCTGIALGLDRLCMALFDARALPEISVLFNTLLQEGK